MTNAELQELININIDKFLSSRTYIRSNWPYFIENYGPNLTWIGSYYPTEPLKTDEKIVIINMDKKNSEIAKILNRSVERVRQHKFKGLLRLLFMKRHKPDEFNQAINDLLLLKPL